MLSVDEGDLLNGRDRVAEIALFHQIRNLFFSVYLADLHDGMAIQRRAHPRPIGREHQLWPTTTSKTTCQAGLKRQPRSLRSEIRQNNDPVLIRCP